MKQRADSGTYDDIINAIEDMREDGFDDYDDDEEDDEQ